MNESIAQTLMLAGGIFLLLAAIGILRMPDLFMRMQASAKASTLGAGLVLLGVAFHFGDLAVTSRALLVLVFLFLTAPVAAHMIARAAYIIGVPLWPGTIRDDLQGRYNLETRTLESPEEPVEAADGGDDGSGAS